MKMWFKTLALVFMVGLILNSCGKKESIPTRPMDPWVFRSVLDDQARMITVALHENLYFAFDAKHAGMYKAWKGGVILDGAVYTTKHGPQPTSSGYAYYDSKIESPVWFLEKDGSPLPAIVRFGGYRFENDGVVFQYRIITDEGHDIHVNEQPEYTSKKGQTGLVRKFKVKNLPDGLKLGYSTAFSSLQKENDFETNATFVESGRQEMKFPNGKTLTISGIVWLNPNSESTVIQYFHPGFDKLMEKPDREVTIEAPDDDIAIGQKLIAGSDCKTCHNEVKQTIGPSYLAIAERYPESPEMVADLAGKVIKGGSGVWGEAVMNPHPALSDEDAQLMIKYILSVSEEAEETEEPEEEEGDLFVGIASIPLNLDGTNNDRNPDDDNLYPGLVVIAHYIEDYTTETISPPVYSGVAPALHATDISGIGPIKNHVYMEIHGYIDAPKAGSYQLRLVSDYGSRLYINGAKAAESWNFQGPTAIDAEVKLKEGLNDLRIEYFQARGSASISLQWIPSGAKGFDVIPNSALRHKKSMLKEVRPYIPREELVRTIPGDQNPLQEVHPSFDLAQARPDWFKPKVGGMDFLSDGRLVICTWDSTGSVFVLDGVHGDNPEDIQVTRIASGLAEPLGLKVVEDEIYVQQKQELTQLIDHDGDGFTDEYRTVSDQWQVSSNFHEFAFGLEYEDGYFYATLATAIDPGGASTQPQIRDRGKVVKISKEDGSTEFIAHGLRTPNGIGKGVDGELFVTDNQGDWLPSSKVVHVINGAFYGARAVDSEGTEGAPETLPVVWLPQDEIGNSPSQPIYIESGDYTGQMLHGEVTHGGLKRVFAEKVDGAYQGALFRFTQGLEAGVNRAAWTPDGKSLFIGGIGNPGNWAQEGKEWYGLQKITFNGNKTFEMLKVSARTNGMEIEFTEPIEPGRALTPQEYEVKQWYYKPTAEYGGPKLDLKDLKIRSVNISEDRKKVFLELEGMKPGHVIYIRLKDPFRSASGQSLWTTECWYTLNAIPKNLPGFKRVVPPPSLNTLSAEEKEQGWQLLFDGKTTNGWRNFKSDKTGTAWKVANSTLYLDTSQKDGWQVKGGGDIITDEAYEDFELYIEWKLEPGGNSGIIYNVVESDDYQYVWQTGPEYQLLDNTGHPDGVLVTHRAGDLYDMIESKFVTVNPGGEWNRTRIVSKNGKVEHWLNGYLVVAIEMHTPEWEKMISESKFKDMPGFGKAKSGHIALQDHGDKVWFRNIKIRKL